MYKYGGMILKNGQKDSKKMHKDKNGATKNKNLNYTKSFSKEFSTVTSLMTAIIFDAVFHPLKRHGLHSTV